MSTVQQKGIFQHSRRKSSFLCRTSLTRGCEKIPAYNIRGEKKGRFCSEHRSPDMVNVISKTCEEDGCEKQPTYNIRGEKKGRFCADHRLGRLLVKTDFFLIG